MEDNNAKGLPVGIWIRVSTEDQAKGESPEHHRKRAEQYASYKGWDVTETYDLSGISGKTVLDHPEAQRMWRDIQTGRIKALLFSKLARLARNVRELLDIGDFFRDQGANLVSLGENIDTSTPAGRLFYVVLAALAEWEREEIAARVKASVRVRAKMGKRLGGKGQFGFVWVPISEDPECKEKKLVHSPTEAPIVARIFDTFLSEKKYLTTAKIINSKSWRTRNGTLWGKTSIKRILKDEIYAGKRRLNYSESKGNKKSWKLKPETEWEYADVEPIVTKDVFDRVQTIIGRIEAKYPSEPSFLGKYALGGLLVCGGADCKNNKMYVGKYDGMKTPRYRCRTCKSKINEDVVMQELRKGLEQIVIHPKQLETTARSDEAAIKDKEKQVQALRASLAGIERKIGNAFDLMSDEIISKADFAGRYNSLKQQKQEIEDEMPRLEGEIDYMKMQQIGKRQLLDSATRLSTIWDTISPPDKGKLIREIVSEIVVGEDSLHFELFYLPELMPGPSSLGKGNRNFMGSSPQ